MVTWNEFKPPKLRQCSFVATSAQRLHPHPRLCPMHRGEISLFMWLLRLVLGATRWDRDDTRNILRVMAFKRFIPGKPTYVMLNRHENKVRAVVWCLPNVRPACVHVHVFLFVLGTLSFLLLCSATCGGCRSSAPASCVNRCLDDGTVGTKRHYAWCCYPAQ